MLRTIAKPQHELSSSAHSVLPNLVIAGVRKCGTTSLFDWLGDHPQVCASAVKETAYLMDPENPYFQATSNVLEHGQEGYGRYFGHYAGEKIVLEATTRYIYQQTARRFLSGLEDPAHVVFILREPCSRLLSAYRYALNNRATIHPDTTFEAFVRHLEDGSCEEMFQFSSDSVGGREYKNELTELKDELLYGQYVDYLRPWKDTFPAERLHVCVFEEMKHDPRGFVQRLAEKIGIDPGFFDTYSFVARNQTLTVRSKVIQHFARSIAPMVPRTKLTRGLYNQYMKFQTVSRNDEPICDKQAWMKLKAHYQPYNESLANEFGLDLKAWS